MTAGLESARRDWEEGYRRLLAEARDPARANRLNGQVEAITDALRRRVGATFSLGELADAYNGAEGWAADAAETADAAPGWARTMSLAADAAFHLYSRGAVDFAP